MSKWGQLAEFMIIHKNISHNAFLKTKFQRLGRAALRELSKALEETGRVVNCKVSYNKAGIACSGDFHLRGDFVDGGSFDFFFNLDGFNQYFTYRKTSSQKDYTGEQNLQMPFVITLDRVVINICLLSKPNPTALEATL
jgi:hypothetical protein